MTGPTPTALELRLLGLRSGSGKFTVGVKVMPSIRAALIRMEEAGWIITLSKDAPFKKNGPKCDLFLVTEKGAALIPPTVCDGRWPDGLEPILPAARSMPLGRLRSMREMRADRSARP